MHGAPGVGFVGCSPAFSYPFDHQTLARGVSGLTAFADAAHCIR